MCELSHVDTHYIFAGGVTALFISIWEPLNADKTSEMFCCLRRYTTLHGTLRHCWRTMDAIRYIRLEKTASYTRTTITPHPAFCAVPTRDERGLTCYAMFTYITSVEHPCFIRNTNRSSKPIKALLHLRLRCIISDVILRQFSHLSHRQQACLILLDWDFFLVFLAWRPSKSGVK